MRNGNRLVNGNGADSEAWRPSSERMGKWAYAAGAEAGEGSFERVASLGETPQEIQDELADAVREAQQS